MVAIKDLQDWILFAVVLLVGLAMVYAFYKVLMPAGTPIGG